MPDEVSCGCWERAQGTRNPGWRGSAVEVDQYCSQKRRSFARVDDTLLVTGKGKKLYPKIRLSAG